MQVKTPVQRAAELVGSASSMAAKLGISKSAISQWKNDVPAEHCPSIEKMTGGAVLCEELNTRTDWGYLRGTKRTRAKTVSLKE